MLKEKRILIVIVASLLLGGLFMVFNRNGQANQQKNPTVAEQVPFGPAAKQIDDAATPIVDFDNPARVDRLEKNVRKLKNARYDKSGSVNMSPRPDVKEVIGEPEWRSGYSDLPTTKSDVIVEAVVSDSNAFLSEDKSAVYSEFTILVSNILKVVPGLSVNVGDKIVTERFGGKVRYPSGQVIRWRIAVQGIPIVGKRYLFFLAKADQDSYKLLTAYEIHENKIFALDGSRTEPRQQGGSIFDKHNGKDLSVFMKEVEMALKDSHNRSSKP